MKSIRFTTLIISAVFIGGCYYDKEDVLYPNGASGTCNPGTVTFATTINGIINTYGCLGCHGTIAPSGNITLVTYTGVKAVASNGKLYGSITHSSGFTPMPQGGAKMNNCDIAKVKAWIDAGAPNN